MDFTYLQDKFLKIAGRHYKTNCWVAAILSVLVTDGAEAWPNRRFNIFFKHNRVCELTEAKKNEYNILNMWVIPLCGNL